MKKLLFSAILMLLAIYPLAKARKNIITENELFGTFLGNYIYFAHYFLIIAIGLFLVHYLIFPLHKKALFTIISLFLIFVGALGYYNYRNPKVTYTNITLDKVAERENIRIAFVADFHLASMSNKNLFIDMVEIINEQKPDIILIGGDILQDTHKQVKDDYSNVFNQLQSTFGTYAILGNHEYYGNDVDENLVYLKNLGINILRDEVLKIDGINFIARDDVRRDYMDGERKTLDELILEAEISTDGSSTEAIIVVDHNPQSIPDTVKTVADIQLSAHTHAGQFFPYNLLLKTRVENAYGYKKIDNLHTVVTSGVSVGYWKIVGPWQMPYRFGTRSEINIIDIAFKK